VTRTTFLTDDLAHVDRYKLTTGLIVPRPIGWIGSYGADRVPNLAPYSFFNAVASNPPVVMFSTGINGDYVKDSLANVRASGVFTANLVDMELSVAMNETSAEVPPDVDEFERAGLTVEELGGVDAPAVAEAKAVLECRVVNELRFGEGDPYHVVVFGEVVAFHVDDGVLDGTRVDPAALDALGRLAGMGYSTTRDRLTLDRPT
jgi:flavin reductase (DIM6/NTAB) family NADH-FMN oxidoreductase RutF